jgi:hypothetical protein
VEPVRTLGLDDHIKRFVQSYGSTRDRDLVERNFVEDLFRILFKTDKAGRGLEAGDDVCIRLHHLDCGDGYDAGSLHSLNLKRVCQSFSCAVHRIRLPS